MKLFITVWPAQIGFSNQNAICKFNKALFMKNAFILALLVPVICFSQQPVKPLAQSDINMLNVDMINADISSIREKIKNTNEQMQGLKDELTGLRTQQNALAGQKQRLQFEVNQLEHKTNRSVDETAQLQQSKNQIKNINLLIDKGNQQIKEISDSIALLEVDLQIMEEKLKELEQQQSNLEKKEQQAKKDANKDPVKLFAQAKLIYDSLSGTERSKLNASQINTYSYYNDLYNSNINFKSSVTKEIKTNLLIPGNEIVKENSSGIQDNNSALVSRLKESLDLLAKLEHK
jgi:septal ring factor EnvC (AmiA/AmiB activator)